MRTYTIEITAKTPGDAEVALEEIRSAISQGCATAPWTEDEDDNGYNFSSEGEFDDQV